MPARFRRRLARVARREEGFTLVELLVASALTIVVMSATLSILTSMQTQQGRSDLQNEAQEQARSSTETLARQLRNVVVPAPATGGPIERASGYELVFQSTVAGSTSAGRLGRVRYCYDDTTPTDGKLWMQTQTWTGASAPPVPSGTACPATGWSTQRMVATNLVNRVGGQNRAVFARGFDPPTSTDPADVVTVRTSLFVDRDVTRAPGETRLSTAVKLRNANRRPIAAFHAVQIGSYVSLDASPAVDPEGQPLTYSWSVSGGTCRNPMGNSANVECGPFNAGTSLTFTLTVTDAGGLSHTSNPKQVTMQ